MSYVNDRTKEILALLSPEDRRILEEHFEVRISKASDQRPLSDGGIVCGLILGLLFGVYGLYTLNLYLNGVFPPPECPPPPPPTECPVTTGTPLEWVQLTNGRDPIFLAQNSEIVCVRLDSSEAFFCEKVQHPPETLPYVP